MQLHKVISGSKARTSWANFQGQEKLTKPFWNVQFDKKRNGQVVGFNEKVPTNHKYSFKVE
jgi:hypothetical protein